MSAVPAYSRYNEPAYRHSAERQPKHAPSIHVVPGRKSSTQSAALPHSIVTLAKALAVIFVVIALLGFVRVTLSSATVGVAKETRALSSQISLARTEGSTLEVTHSSLSNPIRIQTEAMALGMAAPESVTYINLGRDIVATDEAGNLSLSGTVAAIAEE